MSCSDPTLETNAREKIQKKALHGSKRTFLVTYGAQGAESGRGQE